MLFNSFAFATFFAAVYVLYLACRRWLIAQNALLLAASYFFYGWWDWRFLGLIVLSTLIDFVCGRELDRRGESASSRRAGSSIAPYVHSPGRRRAILWLSVGANLGILGFFKYYDFFAASCADLLATLGLPLEPRLLHLILPVGISFYTFQTLSYTIDIYRGQLRAHRSLLDFAVFVAFFPQLVAGPIVRARDFLPQVSRCRRFELDRIYEGSYLILWGLFKKVVIADNLAVQVDRVFDSGGISSGGAVLVATYAFALQIYCDFSGYSDIARGCAKMMGFDIALNFKLPYFAANPVAFWRRWHISLSSWLRDYLYIPLGGNRKGPRRTCINVLLTMLIGGLWHGAAWTFVIWGAYQGVLLIAYKLCSPWVGRVTARWSDRGGAIGRWMAIVAFFQLVCLGWLIFRAESIEQVGQLIAALFGHWSIHGTGITSFLLFAAPLLFVQLAQYWKDDLNVLLRMPAIARGFAYTAMFYGLVLFGARVEKPFIYFQF